MVSAVIGGYIGLQIGKKITYNMFEEDFLPEEDDVLEEEETIEDDEIETESPKRKMKRLPIDYSSLHNDKPSLEEAAATFLSKTSLQKEEVNGEEPEEETTAENNPYVISLDDYGHSSNTNEKKVLTYYDGDDALVDSDGFLIQDPDSLLGKDFAESFGTWSGDPDVVYLRDEKNDTDYEICRIFESYSDAITGISGKKKSSKARKSKQVADDEES